MGATGAAAWSTSVSIERAVPILVGTLGKAFGCFGAFVAADEDYIEWLLQTARSYIYTTALPQPVARRGARRWPCARRTLAARARARAGGALRRGAAQSGIPLLPSISPIQPVVLGSSARTLAVSEQLFAAGFWVSRPFARPPCQGVGAAAHHALGGAHRTAGGRPGGAAGARLGASASLSHERASP